MPLLTWSQKSLDYWMALARLHDTDGLPIDLIYVHCSRRSALPRMIQNGIIRPVTAEEFEEGITQCVRIIQAGGVEAIQERLFSVRPNQQ